LKQRVDDAERALTDERIQSQYKSMELEKRSTAPYPAPNQADTPIMGSQGADSERSFDEKESAHLHNVINELRNSIEVERNLKMEAENQKREVEQKNV